MLEVCATFLEVWHLPKKKSASILVTMSTPLEIAISAAGSQAALARVCGCTQRAISWRLREMGGTVRDTWVIPIHQAFGIPVEVLRPDLYQVPAAALTTERTAA
jgi:hypothetical protein